MFFNKNNAQDTLEMGIYSLVLLQEKNLIEAMNLVEKCIGTSKMDRSKYDSDEYYADPVVLYYPAFDDKDKVIFENSRLCIFEYNIFAEMISSINGEVCQAYIDLDSDDLGVKYVGTPREFDPRKILELIVKMVALYGSIKNNPNNRSKLQEVSSIITNPNLLRNTLMKMNC